MKRFLAIALIAAFAIAGTANVAKAQFGIKGGIYTTNLKSSTSKDFKLKDNVGYQFGVLYSHHLTTSLVIQPELLYVARKAKYAPKETTTSTGEKYEMQYLQLPVSLQYGINLLIARPYIQAVPFISYAVGKNSTIKKWSDVNRFTGGIGLGFGLDIWKLQLNARYNWDITKNGKTNNSSGEGKAITYKDWAASKQKGIEVSLALIF